MTSFTYSENNNKIKRDDKPADFLRVANEWRWRAAAPPPKGHETNLDIRSRNSEETACIMLTMRAFGLHPRRFASDNRRLRLPPPVLIGPHLGALDRRRGTLGSLGHTEEVDFDACCPGFSLGSDHQGRREDSQTLSNRYSQRIMRKEERSLWYGASESTYK